MLRRFSAAFAGLALFSTAALASSQYIGQISMYLCDGGEDLCSKGLEFNYTVQTPGAFKEDFVFDVVSGLPNVNANWPLVKSVTTIGSSEYQFDSASVALYGPFVVETSPPSQAPNQFENWALTPYADGYYLQISGNSLVNNLSVQGSLSAFDLGGPIILPEASTWVMLGLGFAGLALAAAVRRSESEEAAP